MTAWRNTTDGGASLLSLPRRIYDPAGGALTCSVRVANVAAPKLEPSNKHTQLFTGL